MNTAASYIRQESDTRCTLQANTANSGEAHLNFLVASLPLCLVAFF
jgi:hypothetical protein